MNNSLLKEKKSDIALAIVILITLLFPIFSLPRPATLTGQPWKIELLSSLFLLLISIVLLFTSNTKPHTSNLSKFPFKIVIPLILFIIWSGLSYFWANSPRSVAHHTFVWINYLITFTFCLYYFREKKSFLVISYVFCGISIMLFLLISIDYLMVNEFQNSQERIRAGFSRYAEMLLVITPVLWVFALYSKKSIYKNIYLVAGICAWMTIMLSTSKGAFLAGICSFLLLFLTSLLYVKPHFRHKILAFVGIWLAVTVGTQLIHSYSAPIHSTSKRFSGEGDFDRKSSFVRAFTWYVSLQMIRENALKGVGADNFGSEFNNSRRQFAKANPDNPLNIHAEDYFIERTHNEFLQILAELGVFGLLLFLSIFALTFFLIFKLIFFHREKFSIIFWGYLAGIGGFFISSMLSSFSFRVIQNGIVFFIVFALMIYELTKRQSTNKLEKPENLRFTNYFKPVFAGVSVVLLISILNFATYSISDFQVYFAEKEKDLSKAEKLYESALHFNNENASVYLSKGGKFYYEKRYREAVSMFQKVIKLGAGTSIAYYYLAQSQSLSGDKNSAEQTLAEAIEFFPHSTYLRTHYGVLLNQNDKSAEAAKQFEFAHKLNPKEARTWKLILEESTLEASLQAEKDDLFIKPKNLQPYNVMLAIFFDDRRKTSVSQKN